MKRLYISQRHSSFVLLPGSISSIAQSLSLLWGDSRKQRETIRSVWYCVHHLRALRQNYLREQKCRRKLWQIVSSVRRSEKNSWILYSMLYEIWCRLTVMYLCFGVCFFFADHHIFARPACSLVLWSHEESKIRKLGTFFQNYFFCEKSLLLPKSGNVVLLTPTSGVSSASTKTVNSKSCRQHRTKNTSNFLLSSPSALLCSALLCSALLFCSLATAAPLLI